MTESTEKKPVSTPPPWRPLVITVVVIALLDQVTKYLATIHLTVLGQQATGLGERLSLWLKETHPLRLAPKSVIDFFWAWRYAENPGAAWSFAAGWSDAIRRPFFAIVPVIAIVLIARYYRQLAPTQMRIRVALSLIMGGALGNLIDRLLRGYVIDFIDWHWNNQAHWPTFNVADIGVSVGVGLIVLDSLLSPSGKAGPASDAPAATSR